MKFNNNEEAVSPVIGVILMVAITVILAAVIAVFVFGMADDIDTGHTAAATAKVSGNSVIVTYQGGADKVINLNSTLYDATGGFTADMTAEEPNPVVGYSETFENAITDDNAVRIVVTAEFEDHATQVLLDKNLI